MWSVFLWELSTVVCQHGASPAFIWACTGTHFWSSLVTYCHLLLVNNASHSKTSTSHCSPLLVHSFCQDICKSLSSQGVKECWLPSPEFTGWEWRDICRRHFSLSMLLSVLGGVHAAETQNTKVDILWPSLICPAFIIYLTKPQEEARAGYLIRDADNTLSKANSEHSNICSNLMWQELRKQRLRGGKRGQIINSLLNEAINYPPESSRLPFLDFT